MQDLLLLWEVSSTEHTHPAPPRAFCGRENYSLRACPALHGLLRSYCAVVYAALHESNAPCSCPAARMRAHVARGPQCRHTAQYAPYLDKHGYLDCRYQRFTMRRHSQLSRQDVRSRRLNYPAPLFSDDLLSRDVTWRSCDQMQHDPLQNSR